MEEPNNSNHQSRESRVEDLHLDRVVASHPEIGPTPPDGGYGWVIVISAIIYNVTVPPLLFLYGLIILKSIREEDHDEGEKMKIWDVDVALVPVIMIVIKLLLESWCRVVVKMFNMPRFTALAGLCMTVAGVLLSSYSTSVYSNDHIINIFSGIFVGSGYALTTQQTEVIIGHYFRDKLTLVQRLIRMAPTLGNVLVPIIIGYLCTVYNSDTVVMLYGAILMQNCLFLATYTRPVYIERVIRTTYNMIRAAEDEDEVIFSNQNPQPSQSPSARPSVNVVSVDDDPNDVVVFKSKRGAKEVLDPEVEYRSNRFSSDFSVMDSSNRFSSDFGTMYDGPSRFSSDFGALDINVSGYQELASIDREGQNPQPLYRGTTVDAPSSLVFPTEVTPGTARRTASIKKNFITVTNMLLDVNFYLYTLLHLCNTFSMLLLGVIYPPLLWELNPALNIWSVATMTGIAHAGALCFIMLCVALPKTINETSRLYAVFCLIGAIGFYGITLSTHKSFLVVWCMLASLATAASGVLQQPLYNSLNDFDTTATITSANTIVAAVLMVFSISYSYEYKTLFFVASLLQTAAAGVFFATSFRRRR